MRDLLVIGGGPAGYVAALLAAKGGLQVTLVDRGGLGGTCLHRGCIPTKTLYRHAEVLRLIKESEVFGFTTELKSIDLDQINGRKEQVIQSLEKGIQHLLDKHEIEVIKGSARFTSSDSIEVVEEKGVITRSGKRILIATGSKPFIPPIPGCDSDKVRTTETFLTMEDIPEHLLVIGGGVIGLEMACIYEAFGSKITVVEMEKNILPGVDSSISKRLKVMLKKKGINIKTSTKVCAIHDGTEKCTVEIEDKKGITQIICDKILLSTGRVANVDNLGLEEADVTYEKSGISVDKNYCTSKSNIFAVGDVVGECMLAHAASYQAKEVVHKILNPQYNVVRNDTMPACIFTTPEIATVGLTTEQAKEQGIKIQTSQFNFAANGKALALGEGEGFIKVIADEQHIIRGVHIMGPHASDLINEAILAVKEKMQANVWEHVIHPHPTLGEVLHEAILGIEGLNVH